MPIVDDESGIIVDAKPSEEINVLPTYQAYKYDPSFEDADLKDINKLLPYVSGYDLTLEAYYSQVITKDTQLSGQQYTLSPVLQQYRKIKNLKIRVDSPLEPNMDSATKIMTYQGSGTVFNITPNDGDMFIVRITPSTRGLFHISQTVKKSVLKETVYTINYQIDNDSESYIANIDDKVISEYIYLDKEDGSGAIVTNDVYQTYQDLKRQYKYALRNYINEVINTEFGTILLPNNNISIYDPFLLRFIRKAFGVSEHPDLHKLYTYGFNDTVIDYHSIYDAILKKDESIINIQTAGIVDLTLLDLNYPNTIGPSLDTAGIDFVIYPTTVIKRNNPVPGYKIKYIEYAGPFVSDNKTEQSAPYNSILAPLNNLVLKSPDLGTGYVLSKAYYSKNTTNFTLMDSLVNDYFNDIKPDPLGLLNLLKSINTWSDQSFFYYTPIVLYITKLVIKGLA